MIKGENYRGKNDLKGRTYRIAKEGGNLLKKSEPYPLDDAHPYGRTELPSDDDSAPMTGLMSLDLEKDNGPERPPGPFGSPVFASQDDTIRARIESARERGNITFSILGIFLGLFFLSPNLTGNAISNMTTQTASWIGAVLMVIGIIALYFLMKAKKRKNQQKIIPVKKISKKKKR